ncbi:hypothetical protein JOF53_003435 [Crossiella equi]|uniref:Uncharacterized protein n=1 Tax=Crossiella equi TaxID=130796 RepID=A0ABS5ADA8_9PSEU|nr:Rv3235 family protein [Crossiella equi]MBP2474563.1 hypothetical protein [Crossiella equi]
MLSERQLGGPPVGEPRLGQPRLRVVVPRPRPPEDPDQLTLDLWAEAAPPLRSPQHRIAWRLFTVFLEVLGGFRPLGQLRPLVSRRVFEAVRAKPPGGPLGQRVRSVRMCLPTEHAIEASATVLCGTRVRAMAARLDRVEGRWLCTALALL